MRVSEQGSTHHMASLCATLESCSSLVGWAGALAALQASHTWEEPFLLKGDNRNHPSFAGGN